MAALTKTELGDKRPSGRYFVKTFEVTPSGAAATTDWIVSGFSSIVAVLGTATLGASDAGVNVVLNANGTSVAAGTNPGNLGVESTGTGAFQVTVLGR